MIKIRRRKKRRGGKEGKQRKERKQGMKSGEKKGIWANKERS